ncbi:Triose-phosphate Transporter [Dissophora globulifera]|uniref:Triose-phosphate Transporter n=1 Tax=Dissophora globulifera TaxID=979702 RepID=A0A9P6UXT8_9FUNG|nr:Triose-phosphate Transporter [Dissophora globulifera]
MTMRESRETTLARRLSQSKPSSSPLVHYVPPSPNNQGSHTGNTFTSSEKAYKRSSVLAGKKGGTEQESIPLQRDIFASTQLSGTSSSSGNSGSSAATVLGGMVTASVSPSHSPPSLSTSQSLSSGSGTTTTTMTGANQYMSAPSHPQSINASAKNTQSTSAGGARTQLGSILASTLGLAGGSSSPSSPNGYHSSPNPSRHFRYPTVPSTNPPSSSSSSTSSTTTIGGGNINSGGAAATESSRHQPPNRKVGSMNDSVSAGSDDNSSSSFKNYTPSVFINIGRTSSSLPQILIPKKRVAQNIMSNLSYIVAWYFFSTALSIYNKNLMGKDNWNFDLPLFVSSIHSGLHFVITACLMHFFPNEFDATRSGKGSRITIHNYVTQVLPCAVAAALEICMANASLMYITLSFYTMIKSSTPIWVLVFAFFFRLEKPRMSLILIIGTIVVGVALTVAGETQFDMTGFILVLSAAVMSGLRWSLTQMLLQKDQLGMDNPVATLYYISPVMFVIMSLLSLVIEDPFVQFESSAFFNDFRTGALTMMMAGGGGLLAFAMTVAEFKLIKNTGTVTLSVAGISKEIVVISLSMLIFGDRLTIVNMLGLMVSIGGIIAYNYDKVRKLQQNSLGSADYEALGTMGRHHKGDNTD